MSQLKIYIPVDAAETKRPFADKTVLETIKTRMCKKYEGFTVYEGTGGWMDGVNLIEENVIVVETVANNADVSLETFGRVNANWILEQTDETAVMFTVDNKKHMEFNNEV